jgi:CrcB protein
MVWIVVGVGGALGSVARHWVNLAMANRFERTVPNATFVVNVIGCLAIGSLAGQIAAGRLELTPLMRTFVFVGLIGGFTTFSSFGLDTFTLAHGGDHARAFLNIVGQMVLGLGAVALAFYLAL